jgi:glucose-1-phosphate thymidylyltransferase
MKGLILSGGRGTRLRPLTHTSAKQLVPIANKPILFYGIEALVQAGIRNIGIIVGDTKKDIMEAVGDGSQWGIEVTYIEQEAPLGLAHAVLTAEEFIGKDPFVMYLGDNLIINGVNGFVAEFERYWPNSQILLAKVPRPEQFGVAQLEQGKVVKLVEKPKTHISDFALVGVYMFDYHIFEAARSIKPSWRDELEITDAIQYLIDNGYEVRSHIIDGWWKDTGKLEDMLEANRIILDRIERRVDGLVDSDSQIEGRVVVEEGAEIINSLIRGPAIIGANSKIVDSFVGPFTAINYEVTIKGSELEHSIILENSSIIDIGGKIVDSLVGKNVEIARSVLRPSAYRFMVGDNSQVGIL